MSGQLVTKFKFVWDDADHTLERWLEEMARQGLHLHKVDCMRCRFVFKRGEPAEMTYRLDFQVRRAAPDYLQLFVDAGWERVDQSFGWQFWRAPTCAGRSPEIFTDTASRIRKYQRLLWLFALVGVFAIVQVVRRGTDRLWDTPVHIALTLALAAMVVYPVTRLVLRIRSLRKPAS
jgi:hypothetical protein